MTASTRQDPAQIDAAKATLRKTAAINRAAAASKWPSAADDLAGHMNLLIGQHGGNHGGNHGDKHGGCIYAAYLPIRSELSPLPLVAALRAAGIDTAMPVTPEAGRPLTFRNWSVGDALDDGPYGTKQPQPISPKVIPDVILVPMLAFDGRGMRLGYGGGFYDRTIAELRNAGRKITTIGLAYNEQRVEIVPTGPYDMALDGIITPAGYVRKQAGQD